MWNFSNPDTNGAEEESPMGQKKSHCYATSCIAAAESSGLSTVVVGGAVLFVLAIILAAVCVCILCYCSRRKKNGNRTNDSRNG